ncbi:MAG TPA: TlpA disulfide reductase family protein [Phycisphaerales bacterium]|nr:TlpA disulfide reductase family protein [Phycisphaerales bacterium]
MLFAAAVVLSAGLSAPLAAPDETIRLTPVAKGASRKIGGYVPQRAAFGAEKPAGLKKEPAGLEAPSYGTMAVAGGTLFILDEPEGKPAKLYIDANHNGDLTDDPAVEWKGKENTVRDKKTTQYSGSAMVDIGEKDKPFLVSVSMYRFDRNDPARAAQKSTLFFYNDYAYEGDVTIGGKAYKALLNDRNTSGDFRGTAGGAVNLQLDVNENGKFDGQGESFDVSKPFNIGGTTYELADVARDGSAFRLVKSSKTVAEVAPPPNHNVGKTITRFEANDTSGKPVKFPDDYQGKIVLIDFWATWCGPCMAEMPNVVKAYEKYHGRGFEILGVSLDNEKSIAGMPKVMADSKMTWRQVADGKGWKAEVGQKYGINSIPATYLVDGSTGKILGANLRGEELDKALEKALDNRSH